VLDEVQNIRNWANGTTAAIALLSVRPPPHLSTVLAPGNLNRPLYRCRKCTHGHQATGHCNICCHEVQKVFCLIGQGLYLCDHLCQWYCSLHRSALQPKPILPKGNPHAFRTPAKIVSCTCACSLPAIEPMQGIPPCRCERVVGDGGFLVRRYRTRRRSCTPMSTSWSTPHGISEKPLTPPYRWVHQFFSIGQFSAYNIHGQMLATYLSITLLDGCRSLLLRVWPICPPVIQLLYGSKHNISTSGGNSHLSCQETNFCP